MELCRGTLGRPLAGAQRPLSICRLNTSQIVHAGRSSVGVPAVKRVASSLVPVRGRSHRGRAPVVRTEAFFGKMFKQDASENTRKKYQDRVDAINALEPQMQALSDEQLRAKTDEFKKRVQSGETLDALLPEAFAVRLRGGELD